MHSQALSVVIAELATLLIGSRVDRVFQGNGGGLYLILSLPGKKYILLVSPDRALPRIHLASVKPAAEDPPHGFILYLRSHVTGARVSSVGLLNGDRIAEVRFLRQGKEHRLVAELFGSATNLILVDSSSTIMAVYHPVPPSAHTARPMMPGLPYTLPVKPTGSDTGRHDHSCDLRNDPSPNRSAELQYDRLLSQRRLESLRASLRALLTRKLAKARRLANALPGEMISREQAELYRLQGDLILANLKNLRNGMKYAELAGYDGITLNVPLDPKYSPLRNAEHYFKKFKKAKSGRIVIAARLQQTADEVLHLEALVSRIDGITDAGELAVVRSELEQKRHDGARSAARTTTPRPGPVSIRTVFFNGWEILVGKNAKSNDRLTLEIARPDDLWFHAEGMPGSHVLIKNPSKAADIPPDVVLKAAALAAFFSKGRNAGKVSVTYTRAGMVKKPKGAKPGQVMLRERKSLMVTPEEG